ncbi:alkaline phosphatase family protein [Halosimplex salinum]|uniref:alkaline phosphatase family protein n=1 Tax=Halosimplex salinum TaxID=1710538 RepID=UPI001F354D22|nr:alkaline phosphatase family protein [Halosimplex salinum]
MVTNSGGMDCLVVGLDAACRRVLDPLFDRGVTPTLESVFERGTSGPLTSQIPPWTPSAWPSLFTGTNPGRHGLFDFLAFDGYDWDVVDGTHLRERAIWEYLSAADRESVVVNVPVTHPPRPFDGALIPGYTAPEDPPCHPDGLLDDVREAIGGYRVYPDADGDGAATDYAAHREVVEMRGDAFRYLADRFEPSLGFLQFQVTDTVFHRYPGEWDAVEAVYGAVDAELDRILEELEPENVLVVSDHGMGEYDDYEFRVNEFLREEGYVAAKRGGEGMPTWATVRDSRLKDGETGGPDRGALDDLVTGLARVGITTQRVVRALDALNLTDAVGRVVPSSVAESGAEQVDFPASTAFCRSRSELGIRINLEGREPNGQVSPEAYEHVRSDLIDLLSGVRTPDGDPVFEEVARREAYFEGPAAEDAVDIVLVPDGFEQFLSARLGDGVFGDPSEPWNHKREGVVAAAGPGFDTDASLTEAHLYDVAPTILALFDLPRADRMDGGVLPIADAAGVREYDDVEPVDATARDGAVEARLADLGYIEHT